MNVLSKSGINWYDMNVLSKSGINWYDMNVLSKTGINWYDLNVLSDAGVNWYDLNVLSKTGINWYDMNVLSKTGINWIVLDDDYAPVENFLAPAVRQTSAVTMADKYIKQAEELNSAGRWKKAVNKYRMVIQICPAFSARASYSISRILADHGKSAEAADTLRLALAENDPQTSKPTLAMLHYNLGIALKKIGDSKGASSEFADAIKLLQADLSEKGGSAQTYSHLGQVYSTIGDTKNANLCYEKAKQLRENKPK